MGEIIPIIEKVYVGAIGESTAFVQLINLFEDYDCDTLHECKGINAEFDAALKGIHSNWYEEE